MTPRLPFRELPTFLWQLPFKRLGVLYYALQTPERLRTWPNLAPKAVPTRVSSPEHDLTWQLPASTAPPGRDRPEAEACRHS